MKNLSLFILTFLLFSNLLFSQNEVIYKQKLTESFLVKPDTIQDETKKMARELMTNASKKMEEYSYSLTFNNNESYYKILPSLEDMNEDNLTSSLSKVLGFGTSVVYTNKDEHLMLKEKELSQETFLIQNSLDSLSWEIHDESKQIGQYLCFKATKKEYVETMSNGRIEQIVTAWFTPEIPFPYGPQEYVGLPGLILEVEKGKFSMYVEKIQLNTGKDQKIERPKKGIKVTQNEFEKIIKEGIESFRALKEN